MACAWPYAIILQSNNREAPARFGMAAHIEGKCKRLSYVHFHPTRFPEAQSRLTCSDAIFCSDRPELAADPPGLRGRGLLASGRGLGLAPARSLFWRHALCLGESDRPDPALPDDRLLRRRATRGPLSGTQGVLSADGDRGSLYYAHSADCTAPSLLDTGCVRGEFAGRFLWLAGLGNLALSRTDDSAGLRLALCHSPAHRAGGQFRPYLWQALRHLNGGQPGRHVPTGSAAAP